MSANHTDRFGYDLKIPEDIREIYVWLCDNAVHIQQFWNFYLELFEDKAYPEVVELAIASFAIIEEAVRKEIIMSICRISDAANVNAQG